MLLLERVRNCEDEVQYEFYKQQWDTIRRPPYVQRQWSQRQEEVLSAVSQALSLDDEEERRTQTVQTGGSDGGRGWCTRIVDRHLSRRFP